MSHKRHRDIPPEVSLTNWDQSKINCIQKNYTSYDQKKSSRQSKRDIVHLSVEISFKDMTKNVQLFSFKNSLF